LISTGEAMQFIYSAGHQIRKVSHELRFTNVVYPDAEIGVTGLDVDSALQNVYWSTGNNFIIDLIKVRFLVISLHPMPSYTKPLIYAIVVFLKR
jgi:hypothetical protein